jgi:tRNA(Ile)-lysidine synthase
MNIHARFTRYVEEYKLFSKGDKILVAVSGGRDSMLLLWLLQQSEFALEIAHCNFQLRGAESDGDEALIRMFAAQYSIPLHVKRFNTLEYAEHNKVSIQIAARELRYNWFETLREQQSCSVIAVAQHRNDSVETVLFNLSRGTGLLGLQGILPKREDSRVVRPLLFLQSNEIIKLVKHYAIPFRDDSSNFSNKYARNKIRLDIIPELEKLNPDFISIMDDNIQRFRDSQELLTSFMNRLRNDILLPRSKDSWQMQKFEIQKLSLNELYFVLEPYGFKKNVLQDVLDSLDKESGRKFESENYILITDREEVILSKKTEEQDTVQIDGFGERIVWNDYQFSFEISEELTVVKEKNTVQIDLDEIIFPLTIRSWVKGDVFQPLGMQGKKKLSDYFIQKKINILDKKRVPILVNGDGRIIWVVNYHVDERFKIRDNTQKVLKLVCNLQGI